MDKITSLDCGLGPIHLKRILRDLDGNDLILDADGDSLIRVSTDDQFDLQLGGSIVFSLTNDGTKSTLMGLVGDYWRIGDAGVTSHSLNSEDDLMITGDGEVKGAFWVDGSTIVAGTLLTSGAYLSIAADKYFSFNSASHPLMQYETQDANASLMILTCPTGSGTVATAYVVGAQGLLGLDTGLFDSVAQPTIAVIEKDLKYTSSSAMTAAGAGAVMTKTGIFTASVVGDIVRVTAGTNATAGWYWITTVTDADNVTLDRNWCTGAVTDGVMLAYHDFTMLSADGICTRCTDGAPDDDDIEIDRPGWLILDLSQANGRLYWRVGDAWHYVDATAGLSMPSSERIDPKGKEFKLGDEVKLIVDRINEDGSFHAVPYRK